MRNKLIMLGVVLNSPQIVSANIYPEGFSDFFAETEKQIHVNIAGDNDGEDIAAIVNYDTLKLMEESKESLRLYLDRQSISEQEVDVIIRELSTGVTSDAECQERLSSCIVAFTPGSTRYVFDFDNALLRLFIAPDALDIDSEVADYESAINHNQAIVNWSNWYYYSDLDGHTHADISNLTTVGLPIGYMSFDTRYLSSSNEFDIYTALYDVDYEGHRMQLGYNEYNASFNSTDYLSNGMRLSGSAVTIGSSSNLRKGKQGSLQRIYFYAPQNGQLEIYRDDRLILNRVVNEGKQYVSYDEMPKGVYSATIVLKVAGNTVLTETRQVVNNNQFTLLSNEFDYVMGVGMFDERDSELEQNSDNLYYARGLINYRLNDALLIGSGLTTNSEDQLYQAGVNFFWGDNLNLDYTAGIFSTNEFYQTGRLSFSPFFLDYREFEHNLDDSYERLSTQLYGQGSYQELGVGVSASLFDISSYLRYSWYESGHNNHSLDHENTKNELQMISGGATTAFLGGYLSVTADYMLYEDQQNELQTNLTWTYSLGDGVSSQVSIHADKQGFESNRNYLSVDRQNDDWFANVSAGTGFNRNNQIRADLSGTASGHIEQANLNTYGYVNDRGQKSISGGISGTQIFSSDGVKLTNERGRSFVQVRKNERTAEGESINNSAQLLISEQGDFSQRLDLYEVEKLVRVDSFSQYTFDLDSGGRLVDIVGDKHHAFTLPGSYFTFDATLFPILSKVLVLDDVFGEPINNLQCVGEGCVGVEPLSGDGVFRINHKADLPFRLVSRKGLCVYDSESDNSFSKGHCLPGLDEEQTKKIWPESGLLLDEIKPEDSLFYLGLFKVGEEVASIISQLEDGEIAYKDIVISSDVYIYIVDEEQLDLAQETIVQDIRRYVQIMDMKNDELFTISH